MEDVAAPEEAEVEEDDDEGTRPDADVADDAQIADLGDPGAATHSSCARGGPAPGRHRVGDLREGRLRRRPRRLREA